MTASIRSQGLEPTIIELISALSVKHHELPALLKHVAELGYTLLLRQLLSQRRKSPETPVVVSCLPEHVATDNPGAGVQTSSACWSLTWYG